MSWLCRLQGHWKIAELSWVVLICEVPWGRQLPWWVWAFLFWFVSFIAQFLGITPFTLSPNNCFFLFVPLGDSDWRHLIQCSMFLGVVFFSLFQMCVSSRMMAGMETSVMSSFGAQLYSSKKVKREGWGFDVVWRILTFHPVTVDGCTPLELGQVAGKHRAVVFSRSTGKHFRWNHRQSGGFGVLSVRRNDSAQTLSRDNLTKWGSKVQNWKLPRPPYSSPSWCCENLCWTWLILESLGWHEVLPLHSSR